MTPTLLKKLQALLSIAANKQNAKSLSPEAEAAYQKEADNALAKAMELATKHGIDISTVSAKEAEELKEPYIKEFATLGKEIVHEGYVRSILESFFKVKAIGCGNLNVSFVGKTSDVAFAKYLYFYLIEEFTRRWKHYRKTHEEVRDCSQRKSFMYGVFCGLNNKLDAAKKAAEAEGIKEVAGQKHLQEGEVAQGYALMVVNEKEQLAAALKEFFPEVKYRKFAQPKSEYAKVMGYREGQKLNIPAIPLNA